MKDKFRVYLRQNTAVCVRNNTTVVLVLRKQNMNITLRSLEIKLYNHYSLSKEINELLKEFYIVNEDLRSFMMYDTPIGRKIQDFLSRVNLLEKEINELKLGGKHFTEFSDEIEAYLRSLNTVINRVGL